MKIAIYAVFAIFAISSASAAQDARQIALELLAKAAIEPHLKYPNTAVYRDVVLYNHGDKSMVCGEVKARRAFRGNTRYQGFMINNKGEVMMEGDNSMFPGMMRLLCK